MGRRVRVHARVPGLEGVKVSGQVCVCPDDSGDDDDDDDDEDFGAKARSAKGAPPPPSGLAMRCARIARVLRAGPPTRSAKAGRKGGLEGGGGIHRGLAGGGGQVQAAGRAAAREARREEDKEGAARGALSAPLRRSCMR